VALKSEQQTGLAFSIPDSQLGDGRAIGSLCAYLAVIRLFMPFPFLFRNMPDSLCLMRLRPMVSGYVTAGLAYGPPEDINYLINMEESIPCIGHLSVALQPA
jgi:hypothetical protein